MLCKRNLTERGDCLYDIKHLFLFLYLFIAVLEDFRKSKISNWWVLFGIIVGFLFLLAEGEEKTLLNGIVGMGIPFVFLFLPYLLRVLGAGDVKLFMVAGLFLGQEGIIKAFVSAFLTGGIYAGYKLIRTKGFKSRFLYLGQYVKRIRITGKLEEYVKGPWERKAVIHFSLCIFLGCLLPVIQGGFS